MKIRTCRIMQPLDAAAELERCKTDRSVAGWERRLSPIMSETETLRVWFIDGSAWLHNGYYWAAEVSPRNPPLAKLPWEAQ